ncbi:Hvo_1808 family surface protein [Salarchaeum sp. III]|uniref:Hvo_1808 family surface protein n=1 Tax=Salarchaeum sp. III TaxID=3107927 RepID=UPI002EDAFE5B
MNTRLAVVLGLACLLALAGCANAPTDNPTLAGSADAPADPASDRLGWEQGYWYNESLPVTTSDGLNETEQDAVVHRAMARVEHIRGIEFDEDVPVSVISRETYREQTGGGSGGSGSNSGVTFDDVRYEALFLVGETQSGSEQSSETTSSSVAGYYSPSADRIVIISDTDRPVLSETTLGHELVHALQYRNFDLGFSGSTLEARSAALGLIEGDAELVAQRYERHCGDDWECVSQPASTGDSGGSDDGSSGSGLHYGIYFTQYFPYSDGPAFVASVEESGGWDAVSDLYADPPASSEQVAQPATYGVDEPTAVSLEDRSDGDWTRLTPPSGAPYAEFGVAGLTGMFAYPAYESSMDDTAARPYVLSPNEFLNRNDAGNVDSSDPINYTTTPVDGWDGDKLYAYKNSGEAAYVWKSVWDSNADAREFAATYRDLLAYWGAQSQGNGVYTISDGASEFADAFHLSVSGDTVTIVNAPRPSELDDVHAGTPTS